MRRLTKQNGLLLFYMFLCIAEIVGTFSENQPLVFVTKPLLMPVLLLWFLNTVTENSKFKNLIATSIVFGFLGDTFLLFESTNELFFLFGLGAFLIGQVLYGIGFMRNIKDSNQIGELKTRIVALVVFVVIYAALLSTLWSELGEFLAPVVIYGLAICFMGITASFRYQVVTTKSFWYIFFGALIFVASDTVIAVDKFMFHSEMLLAQTIIMTTYCLAQYLIVKGAIVYLRNKN